MPPTFRYNIYVFGSQVSQKWIGITRVGDGDTWGSTATSGRAWWQLCPVNLTATAVKVLLVPAAETIVYSAKKTSSRRMVAK